MLKMLPNMEQKCRCLQVMQAVPTAAAQYCNDGRKVCIKKHNETYSKKIKLEKKPERWSRVKKVRRTKNLTRFAGV